MILYKTSDNSFFLQNMI